MLIAQANLKECLVGGYDLHVHSEPSHVTRRLDDFEVLRQASEVQMSGIMLKNHYESTAGRAALLNRSGQYSTRAYGGIVLNWPAGGLNPYAVESALKLGASFVWLPTRDAANCLRYGNMDGDFFDRPGISIFDRDGNILPQIYQILEIIRHHNAVFATGHVSPEEAVSACKVARKMGVRTVLTHPEWGRTKISGEIQGALAKLGVFVEKAWMNIAEGECTAEEMIKNIRQVGCEHIFISTDRGQKGRETPREGMLQFVAMLMENGFTPQEIHIMIHTVPEILLSEKIAKCA